MAKRHRIPTVPRAPRPVVQINLVEAEAWKLGPDDRLLVNIGPSAGTVEQRQDFGAQLAKALNDMGMSGRCVVLTADDITVAVIPPDPVTPA